MNISTTMARTEAAPFTTMSAARCLSSEAAAWALDADTDRLTVDDLSDLIDGLGVLRAWAS